MVMRAAGGAKVPACLRLLTLILVRALVSLACETALAGF